jgi:hypothetical protein
MAQYYAEIQGSRERVTCMGTKLSGIAGHIHGCHTGVRVEIDWDVRLCLDHVRVYFTGGSRRPEGTLMAEWYGDGPPWLLGQPAPAPSK